MTWTKIIIEGRPPFEIPNELRDNNEAIIAALAPIYPQAANADIRRETLVGDDVLIHVTPIDKAQSDRSNMAIHVTPHGKTKGGDPGLEVGERFAAVLSAAEPYVNPVVELARTLEALQPVTEQAMFDHIDELAGALDTGDEALAFTQQFSSRLDDVIDHQPAAYVPLGL